MLVNKENRCLNWIVGKLTGCNRIDLSRYSIRRAILLKVSVLATVFCSTLSVQ